MTNQSLANHVNAFNRTYYSGYLDVLFNSTDMDNFDGMAISPAVHYLVGEVKKTYANSPVFWGICEVIHTADAVLQRVTSWETGITKQRIYSSSSKKWSQWI